MGDQPMMAERDTCEHAYAYHIRGGAKLSVGICVLCRTVNFDDLDRQAAEIERAAYGRAVEALRDEKRYLAWLIPITETGDSIDCFGQSEFSREHVARYLEAVRPGGQPEQKETTE